MTEMSCMVYILDSRLQFSTAQREGRTYDCTVCPRSLDPIYLLPYLYYLIKWVKTSWTESSRIIKANEIPIIL